MTRFAAIGSALLLVSTSACDAGAPPNAPQPAPQDVQEGTGSQTSLQELGGLPIPSPAPVIEIKADGAPRRVAFTAGPSVTIEPLKITGRKPGVVAECAVRLGGQLIDTIGAEGSPSEALSCARLTDAGALPPDGTRRRIGLIYLAGSPNVDHQVAVLLVENESGRWSRDDVAFERFAEAGVNTLASIKASKASKADRQR